MPGVRPRRERPLHAPRACALAARPEQVLQIAGAVYNNSGTYGPITRTRTTSGTGQARSRRCSPTSSSPRRPTPASTRCSSWTFRIIRAVSETEACGFFEGGNAYDDQVVSFGLYNWTVNPHGAGELVTFLAYLRQRDPDAYRDFFGKYGLDGTRAWPRLAGRPTG